MTELLPNTTLTLTPKRVNGCSTTDAVAKVLQILSLPNHQIPQIIFGPTCSSQTEPVASLASTAQIAVISLLTTIDTPELINFPYFMSVQPATSSNIATTTIEFIRRMGYTKIAAIEMDVLPLDPSFYTRASNYGIDVAVKIVLPAGLNSTLDYLELIQESGARIIVTNVKSVTNKFEDELLYSDASDLGMIGHFNSSDYIWIWENVPIANAMNFEFYLTQYNGTLTPVVPEIYLQEDVRNALTQDYNHHVFTDSTTYYWFCCRTGYDSPDDLAVNTFSYQLGGCHPVNAVLAAAYALHDLIYVQKIEYDTPMLINAIKNVDFIGPCGRVQFDQNGEVIFPLGMGNLYFSNIVESYETEVFDMYLKVNDINSVPNDTFPLTVNLTRLTYNGKTYGQWLPDFECYGDCGNGWCVGANDCQCINGWTQSVPLTANSTAPCDTAVPQRDDTIQLLFPSLLFLLTRPCEVVIKNAIASILDLSVNQIETVTFSPWVLNNDTINYEFKIYDSTSQNNLVLDDQLKSTFNQLVQAILNAQFSNSSLLAYTDSDMGQLNIQTRYSPITGYQFFITIFSGILEALLFLVLTFAALLHMPPLRKKNLVVTKLNSHQYCFGWLMDGLSLVAVGMGIFGLYLFSQPPSNMVCAAQPWIFLLSLLLVFAVKLSKLVYVDNKFNSFNRESFNEIRVRLFIIVAIVGITVFLLFLADFSYGKPKPLVEAAVQVELYRDREWVCQRNSSTGNTIVLVMFGWYCLVGVLGLYLRFLCRFVNGYALDPLFSDLFLFLVVPATFVSYWLYLDAFGFSISPVFKQLLFVVWLFANGVFVTLQYLYQFSREIFAKLFTKKSQPKKNDDGEVPAESNPSSKTPVTLKLYEIPMRSIKCRVARSDFSITGLKWFDCEVVCFKVPSQRQTYFGLFHLRPPEDWSGLILTETSLQSFIEMDPSRFVLKLATKQRENFILTAKADIDYVSLVKQLSEIVKTDASAKSSVNSGDAVKRKVH